MRLFPYLLAFPLLLPAADAATAYFAFQSGTASGSSSDVEVTSNVGFVTDPTVSRDAGGAVLAGNGGQNTFVDPNNPSNTYLGTGGGTGTANSFGWDANNLTNNRSFTGSALTVSLNMTGLTDLTIAFGLRAAGETSPGYVPLSFKAIEYSLDGGAWTSAGVSSPTWTVGSGYSNKSVNLSSLDAVEGVSDVRVRFTLEDTMIIPDTETASSIRIDNLVITAVPEPSVGLLAMFPALAFCARRRR